ncbi:MAG: ABC transporter ATP-binding protein [Alphaproteobacteria bacterium]|nr:MAG: ABC transporter ATP-binding protein [Alphaproteobacteria bacterium]
MVDTEAAISVRGLEKIYGGRSPKRALKGIDLDIPQGSLFGLLGPNGAGKSTFINILAGLVRKTAGEVRIWGFDLDTNPRNARVSIGVVPQELVFDAFFTPWEMLEVQAGMYGVPKHERRTAELLRAVRLWEQRHAYSRTLSGGMKRRLLVAKALVHSPPVLILDEPTAGVDIELRQLLWDYVRELHAAGTTIVLTTHYLEEAEELCDRIAIINHGEVVACEPTAQLLSRIDEKEIILRFGTPLETVPPAFAGFRSRLAPPDGLVLQISRQGDDIAAILGAIAACGLPVVDLSTDETDLEDIFLQITRDGAREDARAE